MPAKLQALPTTPTDAALAAAATRLKAARDAVAAAEERMAAYDIGPDESAEANAQERVRLADEHLADALADDDETAIAAARERAEEAIAAWNTLRGRANDRRSALRALERRRDAAVAEQEAAQAAMRDAEAAYLRGELEAAEASYATAAAQARDTYCRVRAVHWELKLALGDAGKGMGLPDTNLRLPTLGEQSRLLRPNPSEYGPLYDSATGTAHVDAATEALRAEIEAARGGA